MLLLCFYFLGPGISSCSFSNFRDSTCELSAFQVSEIPADCTSLNYLVAIIDNNYCIGPSTSGSDYGNYILIKYIINNSTLLWVFYVIQKSLCIGEWCIES